MAKRNSARSGRSRKRRTGSASASRKDDASVSPRPRAVSAAAQTPSADERPHAPWHPLPLSELLILVGTIVTVIGLRRAAHGFAAAAPALVAGLAAVMIGTVEVTLREHRSGYRSHALILALLPVVAFHSAVVLIVAAFTQAPRALSIGLLPLDVALFAVLFKLLRARFADARRERTFAARR